MISTTLNQQMPLQISVYASIVRSRMVSQLLSGSSNLDALPAITLLRKLCNHPHLIIDDLEKWQHLKIDSQSLMATAGRPAISKLSGGS